jgi:hypothetical protein
VEPAQLGKKEQRREEMERFSRKVAAGYGDSQTMMVED